MLRSPHGLTRSYPLFPSTTLFRSLTLPGAAPAQLETEVARRVEDALSSVTGVKHLRTSITDGSVAISVEFLLEKNLSDALVETKDAIDGVRSDLRSEERRVGQDCVSKLRDRWSQDQ